MGIGKYRSDEYAKMKYSLSSIAGYGRVDLKLTGAFYDSIRAHIDNDGLMVYALDEKAEILEKMYGNRIYTLSRTWKPRYIKSLQPIFLQNVADSLRQ